jgi:hypothetical protein
VFSLYASCTSCVQSALAISSIDTGRLLLNISVRQALTLVKQYSLVTCLRGVACLIYRFIECPKVSPVSSLSKRLWLGSIASTMVCNMWRSRSSSSSGLDQRLGRLNDQHAAERISHTRARSGVLVSSSSLSKMIVSSCAIMVQLVTNLLCISNFSSRFWCISSSS